MFEPPRHSSRVNIIDNDRISANCFVFFFFCYPCKRRRRNIDHFIGTIETPRSTYRGGEPAAGGMADTGLPVGGGANVANVSPMSAAAVSSPQIRKTTRLVPIPTIRVKR